MLRRHDDTNSNRNLHASYYSTGKDALLETAMALHDAAMRDEYFIKRKLAPNVDFWCVASSHLAVPVL